MVRCHFRRLRSDCSKYIKLSVEKVIDVPWRGRIEAGRYRNSSKQYSYFSYRAYLGDLHLHHLQRLTPSLLGMSWYFLATCMYLELSVGKCVIFCTVVVWGRSGRLGPLFTCALALPFSQILISTSKYNCLHPPPFSHNVQLSSAAQEIAPEIISRSIAIFLTMASVVSSRSTPTGPTPVAVSSTAQSHPYTCNTCQVAFRSSELQRGHMRSDWQ